MISFDLRYLQPETLDEAVNAWYEQQRAGNDPRYLAGGTELVTMARDNRLRPGAVIDLKHLPETATTRTSRTELTFGACLDLNDVGESDRFPLLSAAASRVADHSVRNSITLGGNICGMLPYREAVLPFLVCDGTGSIVSRNRESGKAEVRAEPLSARFDKRMVLEPGEFVVALSVSVEAATAPFWYRRRERDARIDYPLMTVCATVIDNRIRLAVSGVIGFPVRSVEAETALSDTPGSPRHRAEAFVAALPGAPRDDMRGSADYRRELLVQAVADAIVDLEGG